MHANVQNFLINLVMIFSVKVKVSSVLIIEEEELKDNITPFGDTFYQGLSRLGDFILQVGDKNGVRSYITKGREL